MLYVGPKVIPNTDKTATVGLFKNLRLEICLCPSHVSWVALRDMPNEDKTAMVGPFKNLRLEIGSCPSDIS